MADEELWNGRLTLGQGETWYVAWRVDQPVPGTDPVVWEPMPLDDFEARMTCRPAARSSTVRFSFSSTGDAPRLLIEPPPADHPALADPADPSAPLTGWIVLSVGADETAAYGLGGVFDVEVYDPADPTQAFKVIRSLDPDTGVTSTIVIVPEATR